MLERALLVFFISILIPEQGKTQPFSFASKAGRASIAKELKQKTITTITNPVNEQTLTDWKGAFWAMELMLYKPRGFKKRVPAIIKSLDKQPEIFQQSFLEMLITLYPGKFKSPLTKKWRELGNDKVKAMALEQLALAKQFPQMETGEIFSASDYYSFYRQRWFSPKPLFPGKNDVLDNDFLRGQPLLVSFQYRNRDKPGCLMIRTAEHQWLKDEKGNPFCFTQLARSITNMPWYLTNGNTPQGLYRIIGTAVSSNNWIGPTPNLQLVMPLEDAPQLFFSDTTNSYSQYSSLLGPLRKYNSLSESYFAGKIGRSEIIAHGTAIDPGFYKRASYYPTTPSLGCLCSPETWNEAGFLEKSTQKEWMGIVQKLVPQPKYLVVIEWED